MKKLKYILLFLVLLMFMSCESFLDRPPLNEVSSELYWTSAINLKIYMYQFYADLPRHESSSRPGNTINEANSDNLILDVPSQLINGETIVNTGGWMGDWSSIRSINIFFDNYRKCEDVFDRYKQYLGEAYFFKAWLYFGLVKKYGDVPWYNAELYPNSEGLLRPRDPRTAVIDSILSDLDNAFQYLGTIADLGNSTLSKEAALAFKTRVALYEGTWQKYHAGTPFATQGADPSKYFQACVSAAEELINGNYTRGIYNTGKPDEDYYTLFGMENMSSVREVLFYRPADVVNNYGHNADLYAKIHPYGRALTWWLVSSYLGKDGNPFDYKALAQTSKGSDFLSAIAADCDPRLESTVWTPGKLMHASTGTTFQLPPINEGVQFGSSTGFQYRKFSNPEKFAGPGVPAFNGYILFRYAEVLLNYAEAKYELDGTVAIDQLNLLRARAGMPDFTVNLQSADPNRIDYGYPISDALYEIRRERRVETPLENGLRVDDWKRWAAHALFKGKRPKGYPFKASEFPNFQPNLDADGRIDPFLNVLPNGYQFRPGQDYLNDIPRQELIINPNLTQNPGWPSL